MESWEPDTLIYPVSLEHHLSNEDKYYSPKDTKGLPMKKYKSMGLQYNPTRISSYGLANWNRWIKFSRTDCRDIFLQVAKWFMRSENGAWKYEFDWFGGDLKAPWISCMAQGQGISILVRAYRLTGENKFLNQAFMALNVLLTPIENGGLASDLEGDLFFEEYPLSQPMHVLNGFLFTMIGLIELYTVSENKKVAALIEMLGNVLQRNLYRWDLNGWSAYDLHNENNKFRNFCTVSYHGLHVTQLKFIGNYLNIPLIKITGEHWDYQRRKFPLRLRAMIGKIRYRLLYRPQR